MSYGSLLISKTPLYLNSPDRKIGTITQKGELFLYSPKNGFFSYTPDPIQHASSPGMNEDQWYKVFAAIGRGFDAAKVINDTCKELGIKATHNGL